MRKMLLSSLALAAVTVAFGAKPDAEGFVSIFNGKDLTGWVGATNSYVVEEGGADGFVAQAYVLGHDLCHRYGMDHIRLA